MNAPFLSLFASAAFRQRTSTAPEDSCRSLQSEADLAEEIAQILQRPPVCLATATSPPRWLGDEEDNARVDAFSTQPVPQSSKSDEHRRDLDLFLSADTDEVVAEIAVEAPRSRPDWIRNARRQRFRNRLRNAASWALSIIVSIGLATAIGLLLIGSADKPPPIEQLRVRPIKLSEAVEPVSAQQPGTSATVYGR